LYEGLTAGKFSIAECFTAFRPVHTTDSSGIEVFQCPVIGPPVSVKSPWQTNETSLFIASQFLQLSERSQSLIQNLSIFALLIQAGIWLGVITISALEQYRQRTLRKNPAAATTINALVFLSRIVIWSVVVLVALDNLRINVNALVAGLGIGSVAVALSVQNIPGDLFAALSIILDKPFVIGDFLMIDDYLGSVEYVGLETTRVRSLSGEQLIFSNSDLLNSCIRNYGRMFERRVVFGIGVTYDTPRDKLKRTPELILEAI
jgi:small-conductance mechanosensitive channel